MQLAISQQFVQKLVWRGIGKPLSEPMMVTFIDAYMFRMVLMNEIMEMMAHDICL